jgi:DNA-binding beta-propeller fold protein YncE
MAFHPTQHVAYVGVPNGGAIAIYKYSATGTLNLAGTVADAGNAVCWFAINSAGTRLYSVENGSGTVSVYDITNATAPVFLQSLLLSNQPQAPTNVAIDPTGNFAYVIGGSNAGDQGAALLHVLTINQTTGDLSETVPAVPLNIAQGEHASGLATLLK